ncbi:TlyA family RNA methyltransferase [bacterium]|nr:TlyA family RNA methyltransferase [bacterium]
MKKERLDKYLTDLGYFENKSKASAAILAGDVLINDERITKAGYQINTQKEYNIRIKSMPYVSRGGFKLEKALKTFDVKVQNRICLDAGASTGGFTDCLLQNGAKFVYAVDVGYGQLDWKIRNDNRVKPIEKTNLKICSIQDIYAENEPIADLLVCDVSFISLEKVLPNFKKLLQEKQELICLIKPQFEAGKELVEKGGVIKNKNTHYQVIENVIRCAKELNYNVLNLTHSAIKGPCGNIEYLIHLTSENKEEPVFSIKDIVDDAFIQLNPKPLPQT